MLPKYIVEVSLFVRVLVRKLFRFSFYRTKVRLLVDVSRIFHNFILKRFFRNGVLELSKANKKQRRSINFCVGTSAKTVFGSAFIETKLSLS